MGNRSDHRTLARELGRALTDVGVLILHQVDQRRVGDRCFQIVERTQRVFPDVRVGIAQRLGDGGGTALLAQLAQRSHDGAAHVGRRIVNQPRDGGAG